jgi:hypothetical protein
MKSQMMYIEYKSDDVAGPARIGLVTFSKSGRTLRYQGKEFLPVCDYKANYIDAETGERYWISGCKKKGDDTLYPGIVEIDEDVREDCWLQIRNRPDCVHLTSFRSEGKYSKRKPK